MAGKNSESKLGEDEEDHDMALETVIGYLVALALPLWLVVEGIKHMDSSPKQSEARAEADRRSAAPVTGATAGPIRHEATRSRQPRIAA